MIRFMGIGFPSGYKISDARGYEVYLNNPGNTSPEELLTEICVPVE